MKYLALILLLVGCTSGTPDALPNLQEVEPGLFRGGQPSDDGFRMLKLKGVRTIIKLNTENLEEEKAATDKLGITLLNIPLSGILAPNDADEVIVQFALSQSYMRPIYVHCQLGKDRTGLAIALYRIRENHWNPSRAHDEWMELGHSPFLFMMDRYFWKKVTQ